MITDTQMETKGDYRMFMGGRAYRRYRTLGWYWSQIGDPWVKTGEAYEPFAQNLRIHVEGYGNGNKVGTVNVTYYVKVRGRSLDGTV